MLYYNWNGPVKVPSVCQEAHTLAYHEGTIDGNHTERKQKYQKLRYYLWLINIKIIFLIY